MKRHGRLIVPFMLFFACGSLTAGGEQTLPSATVVWTASGLEVTETAPDGQVKKFESVAQWSYVTPTIQMVTGPKDSFSITKMADAGHLYTRITSGSACMIYDRLETDPEPTLVQKSTTVSTELVIVVDPDRKYCGGCVLVWNRTNLNPQPDPREGCPDYLLGSWCQYCTTDPCPPPKPEPVDEPWCDPEFDVGCTADPVNMIVPEPRP